MTSIPITFNIHYTMPKGGVNLHLFAGVGYYLSKMKIDSSFNDTLATIAAADSFSSNSMSGQFGFQGGLGLEVPLSGSFSFVVDITGRYVSLTDIKGNYTSTYSEMGSLISNTTGTDAFFYAYEYNPSGTWYKEVGWSTDADKPSGTSYRNVAHGKFDLTGVSAQAGFKVRF